MSSPFKSPITKLFYAILVIAFLFLAANSIRQTLPPKVVVIETGPVGGSYHDSAVLYARKLEAAGFKTEVRPNPQTLEIIDHIETGEPRVDIGFTIQSLDRSRYPNTLSAGVVELQPLFIFYNSEKVQLNGLTQLLGKRLVMPPEKSATAEAARSLLSLYGVTPANTSFTYLPIAQGANELKNGQYDAGFFMLAPANRMIRDLLATKTLVPLSLKHVQGISHQLDFLNPTVLHLGVYDLQAELPASDVNMLGGTVNVMVRKDINPALLYALLEAMKETHQGQTLVSDRGEFPTVLGTALAPHPLATQWAKTGTPWIFSRFGSVLASLIDKYGIFVLVMVIISEIYRTLGYLYDMFQLGISSMALGILIKLRKRDQEGLVAGPISKNFYRLAQRMSLVPETPNEKAQVLLEKLKSRLG